MLHVQLFLGGIVVHQIPNHVDGRPIYAQYQMVFGRQNVRSEFISAGSRIIVANKKSSKIPDSGTFNSAPGDFAKEKRILDYNYLIM